MKIGAVILAAGEGRRFGKNKLLEKINGKTIIEHVLSNVDMERAIIVGKYAQELFPYLKNEIVIYNPKWMEGISTSIKLGLRFFQNYDGVLIALGDMPFVKTEDIHKIIDSFNSECNAIIPTYKETWGNPVILSKKIFDKVMEINGDVGAKKILKNMKNLCFVECSKGVIIDIDTINDLLTFEKPP
ncbi:nucleotidyltransferase family protein [Acidianus sp. HS-5]|uniref:nucleotidyltransferase family protein n=1 Tax=Acidianus sp. HS-5 TaxID=2886040 RepID=UPI001F4541AB|nr:nucleotidyltransferase family protein [Acidianus sp. HS-5]BDC18144.1 4-diphosphocytidyl-2C-methyl-D-erythritol kinase [Acidianus sp. HS-5]